MPTPLLPQPNDPGSLQQRFGRFFGPQTITSNLTMGNNAIIETLTSSGATGTIAKTVGVVTSAIGYDAATVGRTVQPYFQSSQGVVGVTTDAAGNFTITFPVAFPTQCDYLQVVNANDAAPGNVNMAPNNGGAIGRGSTIIRARTAHTGAALALTNISICWFAMGH
jgi:hypothetical protein